MGELLERQLCLSWLAGKAGTDAGCVVAGSHAAQRVQGGEAAGVPAALCHDEPAPGPAAQLRLPGALLLRAAPGPDQRGPGRSLAPCAAAPRVPSRMPCAVANGSCCQNLLLLGVEAASGLLAWGGPRSKAFGARRGKDLTELSDGCCHTETAQCS